MRKTAIFLTVLCAACAGGKAPIEDEGIEVAANARGGLKTNTTYVGDVIYGEMKAVSYNKKPRYRTVRFAAPAGDVVDVWVRGRKPTPGQSDPDAMVWLYDYTGALIAMNDDDSDATLDAHVQATLPPSNGFYYIYLRDYGLHSETFLVTVQGGHGPGLTADAERAYDAASDHLDDFAIDPTALPAGAKTIYDKWSNLPKNGIFAYRLAVDGQDVYVVALAPEEEWLVDLFDAGGQFLVHGWDGDGGPGVAGWGSYPSWDPTR
jgi:hypothetical protein